MIKKALFIAIISSLTFSASAATTPTPANTCQVGVPKSSNLYTAVQWYADSAERNAIYREVFYLAELQIRDKVRAEHLRAHHWGVVFDIDDTLLSNAQLNANETAQCRSFSPDLFSAWAIQAKDPALPGAVKITCGLQKMGAYVTLVTNRDGSYVDPTTHEKLLTATLDNLKQQGICFDQVILAKNNDDWNKTPRFNAVESGKYAKDMVYSKTLPAHKVLAFFGDNIQDMPNLTQAEMIKQDPNGKAYNNFGTLFFSLPNPMYGSWMGNSFTVTVSS